MIIKRALSSGKRTEIRSCRLMLRLLISGLLIYSILSFTGELIRLRKTEQLISATEEELLLLQEENLRLREQLSSEPEPEKMRRLAWEKLGMVMPEEIIFVFEKDREEPRWGRKLGA